MQYVAAEAPKAAFWLPVVFFSSYLFFITEVKISYYTYEIAITIFAYY